MPARGGGRALPGGLTPLIPGPMLHPRIHVNRPLSHKPQPLIKPQRVNLRPKLHLPNPRHAPEYLHRKADQIRPHPHPPGLLQYTNPPDLANLALHQQPRRAHRNPAIPGQQMPRLRVPPVHLILQRHALF
jgi:hypothetical protein